MRARQSFFWELSSNITVKISLIFISAVIAITLLSACGKKEEVKPPGQPSLVKTLVLQAPDAIAIRTFPGRVRAGKEVDLAFQVDGPLIEFPVNEGNAVIKGTLLGKLDPRDFQNRLNAEKATLNTATLNYKRAQELIKGGHISQALYDQTKAKYINARSRTSTAEKALNDTKLIAPFDGLVAETFVENHESVRAKQKILSLQDVSNVDIVVNVPEQLILRASGNGEREVEKNAYIVFDSLPDRKFPVSLKKFTTEADPITQTYRITLTMKAPTDITILPGMTTTFYIKDKTYSKETKLLIPINAVAYDAQGNAYTWLVDAKTMTVKKRQVKVGSMMHDKIRILNGLEPGEQIVVAGVPYLSEGMKVRVLTGPIGKK